MTTTLSNMMDEVTISLAGYTLTQDRATHLASNVTTTTSSIASPTILSLGSTDNLGKGIVEIDEELMWVDSYDRLSNTATISPWGRGYLGTTGATHTAGTKVTISPIFPRYVIKRAINDTISALGSAGLLAVKQTTFSWNAAQSTYDFDGLAIQNILNINWQEVGPSQDWIPVRRWTFDPKADATTWGANAQTVTIGDFITPGRTVKVLYMTNPIPFTTNGQDFATQTGLPEACKDVVIYGACYRLLSFLDPARVSMVSPQADETDARRPISATTNAVRQIFALYNQRLNEEVKGQQGQYPVRVHYSR
jgi:hypothetical protein